MIEVNWPLNSSAMIKVIMDMNKFISLDILGFRNWINENSIDKEDWHFISTISREPVIFMFKNKDDAIAFKLKFGL